MSDDRGLSELMRKSHFELLGLPERFEIDPERLQTAYRRLQSAVHPDRFAASGGAEKRIAMQLATQANEAYRTLSDPGRRAAYLVERHGVNIAAEDNTAMPPEFLMQQMEWRESLEESVAERDAEALSSLKSRLQTERQALLEELSGLIDRERDAGRAADAVRRWMFIDKFAAEVAAAEEGLAADGR